MELANFSARQKGLFLILIPFVFQVCSLLWLTVLLLDCQKSLRVLDHQRAALFKLEKVGNVGSQVIFEIADLPAEANAKPALTKLETIEKQLALEGNVHILSSELPIESSNLNAQTESFKQSIGELINKAKAVICDKTIPKDHRYALLRRNFYATAMAFNELSNSILSLEKSSRETEPKELDRLRTEIFVALCAITILSLAIAAGLATLFARDMTRRIKAIAHNAQMLATGGKLLATQTGSDEIAQLDQALHHTQAVLKNARQQQLSVLSNASEIICSLDQRLRITAINEAVEHLWRYHPEDLLGRSLLSLLVDQVNNTRRDFEHIRLKGIAGTIETTIGCGDNKARVFSWSASWSAPAAAFTCVVRDVTLDRTREQLKHDFISIVSHDLRSPLASLSIGVTLMQMGKKGEIPEAAATKLGVIENNVSRLTKLMDALLELDKLESGHTPLSQAAIHGMNILATARDLCLPQAHTASVTLKVSPVDCLILADQSKLIRATVNLLEYLIVRTPANSQITLSALSTANKSELRLTAPSVFVPETSQNGLFDGFKADHGVQSTPLSDQLALATARAMIVAHGGQISIHSTVDSGTTFSLLLPPAEPAAAEEE